MALGKQLAGRAGSRFLEVSCLLSPSRREVIAFELHRREVAAGLQQRGELDLFGCPRNEPARRGGAARGRLCCPPRRPRQGDAKHRRATRTSRYCGIFVGSPSLRRWTSSERFQCRPTATRHPAHVAQPRTPSRAECVQVHVLDDGAALSVSQDSVSAAPRPQTARSDGATLHVRRPAHRAPARPALSPPAPAAGTSTPRTTSRRRTSGRVMTRRSWC